MTPVAEVTGACLCTSFGQNYSTDRRAWVCPDCGHEEHASRIHCGAITVVAQAAPSRQEREAKVQRVLEEHLLADCPDYWPNLSSWARDVVAALDA